MVIQERLVFLLGALQFLREPAHRTLGVDGLPVAVFVRQGALQLPDAIEQLRFTAPGVVRQRQRRATAELLREAA